MSKKHFIELADSMRSLKDELKPEDFEKVLDEIVRFCRGQNYNFMEGRFRDYIDGKCGPNGGKVKAA